MFTLSATRLLFLYANYLFLFEEIVLKLDQSLLIVNDEILS